MKLRFLTLHAFAALCFLICLPAFAADYTASIPCGGAATLTPADPIVRLKGAGDTLTFDLVPQAGVALSVKNWKINGDPIFEDNEDTMKQTGANWGIFTPTNGRKSLSWKLGGTKDGAFKLTAVLKRSCGGGPNNGPGPDQKDEDLDLWDGTVVSVTFNPTVIKTGYVIPIQDVNMPEIKTIVTATVTPKGETNNIVFSPDPAMQNRAAITEPLNNRDAATGTITLWIKGTSATPSNQLTGDMKILAKVKNSTAVVGSANVIVIVPTKYTVAMQDQDQGIAFKGQVTGHNKALGQDTIPTNNAVAATEVSLNTLYSTTFVVQVIDQFGNPLDKMYQGQPVTEKRGATARLLDRTVQTGYGTSKDDPINQWLSTGGTYSDTVGINIRKILDGVPAVVQNKDTPQSIQQIEAWEAAAPILMSAAELDGRIYINQDYLVRVGGHGLVNPYFTPEELTPGAASITRRIVGFPNGYNGDGAGKKPNTIIILWGAITVQDDTDFKAAFDAQ